MLLLLNFSPAALVVSVLPSQAVSARLDAYDVSK